MLFIVLIQPPSSVSVSLIGLDPLSTGTRGAFTDSVERFESGRLNSIY